MEPPMEPPNGKRPLPGFLEISEAAENSNMML